MTLNAQLSRHNIHTICAATHRVRSQPSIPTCMQRNAQSAICAATRYSPIPSTFRRVLIRTQARCSHALAVSGVSSLRSSQVLSQDSGSSATSTQEIDLILARSATSPQVLQAVMALVPLKVADQYRRRRW